MFEVWRSCFMAKGYAGAFGASIAGGDGINTNPPGRWSALPVDDGEPRLCEPQHNAIANALK